MSHISTYETQLEVNPQAAEDRDMTWDLLCDAAEAAAEQGGRSGEVGDTVSDYFGRSQQVDLAVTTSDVPGGVGIQVDRSSGEVRFLYDDYGVPEETIEDLCRDIRQNYTALAVTQALETLDYDIDLEERQGTERQIVVRGRQ